MSRSLPYTVSPLSALCLWVRLTRWGTRMGEIYARDVRRFIKIQIIILTIPGRRERGTRASRPAPSRRAARCDASAYAYPHVPRYIRYSGVGIAARGGARGTADGPYDRLTLCKNDGNRGARANRPRRPALGMACRRAGPPRHPRAASSTTLALWREPAATHPDCGDLKRQAQRIASVSLNMYTRAGSAPCRDSARSGPGRDARVSAPFSTACIG